MRIWACSLDGDGSNYLDLDYLKAINSEVKEIRHLLRSLLVSLKDYEAEETDFDNLTFYDKLMMRDLLKFSLDITEAYDTLDLKTAYNLIKQLQTQIHSEYLPFARQRQSLDPTSDVYKSTHQVLHHLLQALTHAIAPVLLHTAQEAYLLSGN